MFRFFKNCFLYSSIISGSDTKSYLFIAKTIFLFKMILLFCLTSMMISSFSSKNLIFTFWSILLFIYSIISSKISIISLIHTSNLDKSATRQKILAFNTCLKNAFQSHFHSAAHLINHGISIILKLKLLTCTLPKFGTKVVNG